MSSLRLRWSTRTVAMPDWTEPFARTIDAAKKYVVLEHSKAQWGNYVGILSEAKANGG
jgi:hypothetical protein